MAVGAISFKTSSCRSENNKGTNKKLFLPHASPDAQLISNTNQVVGQLLNCLGCLARLDCVRVVGDQDGLFCLDRDDALFTLVDRACS